MTGPGRLHVGAEGKVTGPASLSWNEPWPSVNGTPAATGAMNGVVMHTMVGNLPGTIKVFNDPNYQASAHFGIDQQGHIHQFGPIGDGWMAWAQKAGNEAWYSIEHADNGDTHNPLTQAQIVASAQLVELLSRFAGFPLQVTDSVEGKGYGVHVMGGAAWGGHTCPGPGPRAGQRDAIIALAKKIRASWITYPADGMRSVLNYGHDTGAEPSTILRMTVAHFGVFPDGLAHVINGGDLTQPVPAHTNIRLPRPPAAATSEVPS